MQFHNMKRYEKLMTIGQSIGTKGNSLFYHIPSIEDNKNPKRQVNRLIHECCFQM
jgi:hypothetical protein